MRRTTSSTSSSSSSSRPEKQYTAHHTSAGLDSSSPPQHQHHYQPYEYQNEAMEFTSSDLSLKSSHQSPITSTTFIYPPRSKIMDDHHNTLKTSVSNPNMTMNSKASSSSASSTSSSHHRNHHNHHHHHHHNSDYESSSDSHNSKNFKKLGGRIVNIMNIPKRIKEHSHEKHRFNIYTVPMETREQLKQIYVY